MILQLELQIMIYVRAIQERDFQRFKDPLTKIVPWFSLDHTQYARWIPVHLHDMVTLKDRHPNILLEFLAHEQNNASVKGDGGAVCLTANPVAL
jgi:hypothetical protein